MTWAHIWAMVGQGGRVCALGRACLEYGMGAYIWLGRQL